MDKVKLLEKHYNDFINLTSVHDFFLLLVDYLEYIESVPEFRLIADRLLAKRKEHEDELRELSGIAIVEIDKLRDKFFEFVTKNSIQNKVIDNSFGEYQSWKDGLSHGNFPLAHNLHDLLCDVVRELYTIPEYRQYASEHIEFWENKVNVKHYLPVKELNDFQNTKEEFDEYSKNELWGRVNKLSLIFRVVKQGRVRHKELVNQLEKGEPRERSAASFELLFGFNLAYCAWRLIQNGETAKEKIGGLLFDIDEIKPIVNRFHNYLLREYAVNGELLKIDKVKVTFDGEKSILSVQGADLKIRKFSDQYHTLRIIFENPKDVGREWFFSEISEKADPMNSNDKRYYNAVYQVNQKLKSVGIKDFFITTRQSVKITPHYLS